MNVLFLLEWIIVLNVFFHQMDYFHEQKNLSFEKFVVGHKKLVMLHRFFHECKLTMNTKKLCTKNDFMIKTKLLVWLFFKGKTIWWTVCYLGEKTCFVEKYFSMNKIVMMSGFFIWTKLLWWLFMMNWFYTYDEWILMVIKFFDITVFLMNGFYILERIIMLNFFFHETDSYHEQEKLLINGIVYMNGFYIYDEWILMLFFHNNPLMEKMRIQTNISRMYFCMNWMLWWTYLCLNELLLWIKKMPWMMN
jgi:hypothetical protein